MTCQVDEVRDYPFHKEISYFPVDYINLSIDDLESLKSDLEGDVYGNWDNDTQVQEQTDDIYWLSDCYYYALQVVEWELQERSVNTDKIDINMQNIVAGV